MKKLKKVMALLLSATMVAGFATTAMAAEERTKITQIKLTVDSSIEAGEDDGSVNISTDDTTYSVSDVEIINDDGEWVSGDTPRVEITLDADADYYFYSMSSSKVKLSGDDATYVSSHREDSNSTLILTIKLDAIEGSMEIENVEWEDEDSPVGTWEEAPGAKSYQVRLYRSSSSVGESVTVTNNYYDFASKITRTGEYYFRVRAVNSNNKKGDWYESDSVYIDDDMLANIQSGNYTSNNTGNTSPTPGVSSAQWVRDNVGWWYRYSNGSYPTNGWLLINNVWYCFDRVGYMRTGWILSADGNYYYCDTNSGAMLTNTWTPDNYYVDANGVWIQGRTR